MFHLGVVDHIRLNLSRAAQNYTVHADAAERLAALIYKIRIGLLSLLGAATTLAIVTVLHATRPYEIVTAVATGAGFLAFALYSASGLETRVQAHRSCAHRLWLVCERHRVLIAEIQDGLVGTAQIVQRCAGLAHELHAVYEQPFPADQRAYERARESAEINGGRDAEEAELVAAGG